MKLAAISDVHVKKPHDEADKLLCSFLDHPEVKSADVIALLGDIFDLMCGPHTQYLKDFAHIFDRLDQLQKSGKKVYFFEGNHDVHLEKLFKRRWPMGQIFPSQIPIIEELGGKTYYLSHGDEHEVENHAYQRYKKTILSPPLRFVANHVMPYSVLNFIGERASQRSRKKGARYFNQDGVREQFRHGVEKVTQGQFDFVLGGHSHVQDNFQIPGHASRYINNGYALNSKTFILIKDHQVNFQPLV